MQARRRPLVPLATRSRCLARSHWLPPERLLIFRPGDGWGPLCDFLGLPVPDTPFPRTNARAEFFANLDAIR